MINIRKRGKVYQYCSEAGTDIIRYPFRIIHHELGIQCRFYDLRRSFATISLRGGVK